MHSSTTAIEFVALVVRPRHVAALTDVTQRAPIVVAFGKRARFVEGVCQYHQRFSNSTYRNAGVWHHAVARQAFGSVHIPRDLSIDKPRHRRRVRISLRARQDQEALDENREVKQTVQDKTERLRAQRLAHDKDRTDTTDANKDGWPLTNQCHVARDAVCTRVRAADLKDRGRRAR